MKGGNCENTLLLSTTKLSIQLLAQLRGGDPHLIHTKGVVLL